MKNRVFRLEGGLIMIVGDKAPVSLLAQIPEGMSPDQTANIVDPELLYKVLKGMYVDPILDVEETPRSDTEPNGHGEKSVVRNDGRVCG